jgi:hypothetical protein
MISESGMGSFRVEILLYSHFRVVLLSPSAFPVNHSGHGRVTSNELLSIHFNNVRLGVLMRHSVSLQNTLTTYPPEQ